MVFGVIVVLMVVWLLKLVVRCRFVSRVWLVRVGGVGFGMWVGLLLVVFVLGFGRFL